MQPQTSSDSIATLSSLSIQVLYVISYNTSSTAQGGGGSFKNRKPIGEVGVVNQGWQSEATDGPKGA